MPKKKPAPKRLKTGKTKPDPVTGSMDRIKFQGARAVFHARLLKVRDGDYSRADVEQIEQELRAGIKTTKVARAAARVAGLIVTDYTSRRGRHHYRGVLVNGRPYLMPMGLCRSLLVEWWALHGKGRRPKGKRNHEVAVSRARGWLKQRELSATLDVMLVRQVTAPAALREVFGNTDPQKP